MGICEFRRPARVRRRRSWQSLRKDHKGEFEAQNQKLEGRKRRVKK